MGAILGGLAIGLVIMLVRRQGRPDPDVTFVRCPIHGIAYDDQLEVCPSCARLEADRVVIVVEEET
jgi:hypothetical protein